MQEKKISLKIAYFLFGLSGFLCAFCCLTGRDLAEQGNILWTNSYTMKTLFWCILFGVIWASVSCFLMYAKRAIVLRKVLVQRVEDYYQKLEKHKWIEKVKDFSSGQIFVISLFLIVISWLPSFLAYYPGNCSYDTPIQIGQIVDGAFNDHHPIAHTLVLQGAMKLGDLVFGDVNTGIAVMVFLQMVILAASMSFGIALVHRKGVKVLWLVLLQLYCMLFRFHHYMSITTIKDTLFSAFFLLLICSLYGLLQAENLQIQKVWKLYILFGVSTIGSILFRNNGKYAFLVLLVILFLCVIFGKRTRKKMGKLLVSALAFFLMGNILLSALFNVTNAQQGDRREMLSMPIQQLARCMLYHGGVGALAEDDNTMTDAEKSIINDFLLDQGYLHYRADISDPVKRHTNTYVVRYRAKEFLTTYLQLLGRYPGEFVNAALAVNAGYLYIADESHAYINVGGADSGMGYVQTHWVENELNARGIYKDSKWESLHQSMEQWADENAHLELPLLRYIYMPGIYLWLYVFGAIYLVAHRRYRECIPLSLIFGYYITLLLGPTVQLRYIYPMMIVVPFVFLLTKRKHTGCD